MKTNPEYPENIHSNVTLLVCGVDNIRVLPLLRKHFTKCLGLVQYYFHGLLKVILELSQKDEDFGITNACTDFKLSFHDHVI